MDVLVVGGHGQVALLLLQSLSARGDRARGLIRNPDHAPDLEAVGAEAVVVDLETDDGTELAQAVAGSDAVVFAAGAGPGSGEARKRTVDLGGAVKLIDACHETGVRRYVMVSAIGVDKPGSYSEAMVPYYDAKREADEALQAAGLEHTIVRPGGLTDEPGTGAINVGMPLAESGQIPREDVAATLVQVLDQPHTIGLAFDVISGGQPISEAVATLFPEPGG